MKTQTISRIQEWLLNPDYDTGVAILATIKPQMARIIAGRPHRYTNKLHYELTKIVGPAHAGAVGNQQPETSNQQPVTSNPKPATRNQQPVTSNQQPETSNQQPVTSNQQPAILTHSPNAPELINQISKEHLRLITLRSQLAEQRSQVPQTNTPANNKKRKTLTQAIHEASDRIEELFNAHSHYMKTKTLPDIQIQSPKPQAPSNQQPATDPQKTRTNIMKAIQKIKTQLDYNDTKKAKKKNPMPRGPKRTKLEQSLKEKQLQLKQIKK